MSWTPSNKTRSPSTQEKAKAKISSSAMIDAFEKVNNLDTTEKSVLARARLVEDQIAQKRIEEEEILQSNSRVRIEEDIGLFPNQLKHYTQEAIKFIEFIFLEQEFYPLRIGSSRMIVQYLPFLITQKMSDVLDIDPFGEYYNNQFNPMSYTEQKDVLTSLYSIGIHKTYLESLWREYLKTFIR